MGSSGMHLDDDAVGLRERKKLRTRNAIADAALKLFDVQGFRATTVAQVAEAADVSPRTVFTYFPTKEDLVFAGADELFADLQRQLQMRPAGELATDALRRWIVWLTDQIDEEDPVRRRVIAADEDLLAHERRLVDDVGDMLAVAFARDLDTDPDDMAARLAGSAAIAALMVIGPRAKGGACGPRTRDERIALVDQALAFVAAGIRALQERRAGSTASG